jgi:colanic acid/amylovoran biosynthesis glycosyltransferase
MRIAFIIRAFPVLSETFILNQITGLIDRGHDVDIFANQRGDDVRVHPDVHTYGLLDRTRFSTPLPRHWLERPPSALRLIAAHCRRHPQAILRSLNVLAHGTRAASFRVLHEIIPFLPAREYDIIQCHFGMLGMQAVRVQRTGVLKGRIVVMFHGDDVRAADQCGPGIYREIIQRDVHVLSISKYNRRHLLKFGFAPGNIIDHPVGIDMKRFAFRRSRRHLSCGSGRECVRILTVARLVREKGLEYGLLAVAKVLARNPARRVHYTIVGDGELRDELQERAAALKLEEAVTFAGGRDQRRVCRELRRADLFLLPSRNEALPVCLMEAQAGGLPVVATSVGSVDEIVENGRSGFLVPKCDAEALADKLTFLVENPHVWPEMGRAGRAHVEANYNIEKLNDQLIGIYEDLLHGRK